MRHVTLTCKKHPNLRWSCKSIAYTPGHGYNGARNIFFTGPKDEKVTPLNECICKGKDLILAPEDPWANLSLAEQSAAINKDVG